MLAGASWDATAAEVAAGVAEVIVDSVGGVAGAEALGVAEGESTESFFGEDAEFRATTISVRTIIPATTAITTRLEDFGLRPAAAGSLEVVEVEITRGVGTEDVVVGVCMALVSISADSSVIEAKILVMGLVAFTALRFEAAFLLVAFLLVAFLLAAFFTGAFLAGAFLAGAFLAGAFFTGAFLAGAFLAGALVATFLVGDFFAGAFLAGTLATTTFFAMAFFTGAFFAGAFFATCFLLTLFFATATC